MKKIIATAAVSTVIMLLSCASDAGTARSQTDSTVTLVAVDTFFRFMHGSDSCSLLLAKKESDKGNGVIEEKTAAWILKQNDTVFKATFNFNTIGKYAELPTGQSFIQLINNGGGSGFQGVLLFINKSKQDPFLDGVTDITELSSWIYSDDGNSVLMAHGMWVAGDPDSENFESHFSPHKQVLYLFDLSTTPRSEKEAGITNGKYDLIGGGNTFADIRMFEPQFDSLINWGAFGYPAR
jgi:hypothetical protein